MKNIFDRMDEARGQGFVIQTKPRGGGFGVSGGVSNGHEMRSLVALAKRKGRRTISKIVRAKKRLGEAEGRIDVMVLTFALAAEDALSKIVGLVADGRATKSAALSEIQELRERLAEAEDEIRDYKGK